LPVLLLCCLFCCCIACAAVASHTIHRQHYAAAAACIGCSVYVYTRMLHAVRCVLCAVRCVLWSHVCAAGWVSASSNSSLQCCVPTELSGNHAGLLQASCGRGGGS
jgi:hypothetical protein